MANARRAHPTTPPTSSARPNAEPAAHRRWWFGLRLGLSSSGIVAVVKEGENLQGENQKEEEENLQGENLQGENLKGENLLTDPRGAVKRE